MQSFEKGDKVEVLKTQYDGGGGSISRRLTIWFRATVLRPAPASNRKGQIYVEYETLTAAANERHDSGDEAEPPRLTEYVPATDVRPVPPGELHRFLKSGEVVEALFGEKKGWRKAKVLDILENSKYSVSFFTESDAGADDEDEEDGEKTVAVVEYWGLRVLRNWDDGSWVPPIQHEKLSPKSERTPRGVKLGVKCSSFGKLIEGMQVEVNGEKEGFQESWFPATIIKSLGNETFLVEYRTLRTVDESYFFREKKDVMYIRPSPPVIQRGVPFEQFALVDAWYNDGWWVGHISKVIDGFKYKVCLRRTDREVVFEHPKLRPHQDWIEGSWIVASNTSSTQVDTNTKELKLRIKCCGKKMEQMLSEGMMVEVKSDEPGYLGSWYTAKIVGYIGNSKYLVEYEMLKTDDESEPLKETADSSYIRPCPPKLQKVVPFKMLEEVDAWYNDGWWVGLISRFFDDLKYAVYFWTSDEELEFGHYDLRSHQEWLDGKWITTFRKKSKLLMKSKLGNFMGRNDLVTLGSCFCNGTKVEVKGDEEGYWHSWYPAMILRPIGNRMYLVEYQTLSNDDETELLKEEADALCIRPAPPVVQQTGRFKLLEEVDAWYYEGWRIGQICKVLEGGKYTVYLRTTNEVSEFQHCDLRPHQDWVDHQWTRPVRGKR